jgi:hypothetical protein
MPSEYVNEKNIVTIFQVLDQLQASDTEKIKQISQLHGAIASQKKEIQELSDQVMGLLTERAQREAP